MSSHRRVGDPRGPTHTLEYYSATKRKEELLLP